jgi:transposase
MDALSPEDLLDLTETEARQIIERDPEIGVWALLMLVAQARQMAEQAGSSPDSKNTEAPDPSTPSSQIPPYKKQPPKKRPNKRGRKKGHKGAKRRAPVHIDAHREHTLGTCPDCGKPLEAPSDRRTRVVEDIDETQPTATKHTIHRYWCSRCKKRVEPRVPDALPGSTIGHRAAALTAWLHYGLGQTNSKIVEVLNTHFHFPATEGGLSQLWLRTADVLRPWYDQLAQEARAGAVLNADETGWRVNGKTHWLWCFANPCVTWYTIDPSRSSRVVREFLADEFEGTVVTDFFGAYNFIAKGDRQFCLVHLLGEIKKVSKKNDSNEWNRFSKKLKRLLRDALRLRGQGQNVKNYAHRVRRIHLRLDAMTALRHWKDPDCLRLAKRLDKARYGLFLFLDNPEIPPDNNRAEREIRPAVIARKNSFQNTSDAGAEAQAIFMSLYRTLKLRDHNPLETIADALTIWSANGGHLPEFPRPPD